MKYKLKSQSDIDLAADSNHRHIPGTEYHWKHNYIPLDARTAALFNKKTIAKRLIKEGKISIHEKTSVKAINSRGLTATHPLTIIPKVHEPAKPKTPEAPKVEGYTGKVSPITPSLAKKLQGIKNGTDRSSGGRYLSQGVEQGHIEVRKTPYEGLVWDREASKYVPGITHRVSYHLTPKGEAHLKAYNEGLRKPTAATKAAQAAGPRSEYEKLLNPMKGDTLHEPTIGSTSYRHTFNGTKWVKEYSSQRRNAAGDVLGQSEWRKLSRESFPMERANRGQIVGIEADKIAEHKDRLLNDLNAASLAASQKKFGKGKVNGFRAASAHDVYTHIFRTLHPDSRKTENLSPEKRTLIMNNLHEIVRDSAFADQPGATHYIHDNGTVLTLDATQSRAATKDSLERLTNVLHDVTTNRLTGTPAEPGNTAGDLHFQVDTQYAPGKSWKSRRGSTLAYVKRGDAQGIHLSPDLAHRMTFADTSAEHDSVARGHFVTGHDQFPTRAHGPIIHEIGHVVEHRLGSVTDKIDAAGGNHRGFHNEQFPSRLDSGVYGPITTGRYAKTDPAEGFAEAFVQGVAKRHGSAPATRVTDTPAMAERRAHETKIADAYASKYGTFGGK